MGWQDDEIVSPARPGGSSAPPVAQGGDWQNDEIVAPAPARAANPQPAIDLLRNSPGITDAKSHLDMLYAGLQSSATGMMTGRPNLRLPENASFVDKLLGGLGQTVGDLPVSFAAMGAGAVAGTAGAPGVGTFLGGAVGFTAAPEAVRQTMMDYYDRDELHTAGDFVHMLAHNVWEVGKAGIVGKAGMVAGKAGGAVTEALTENGLAKTAGNLAGFTMGATEANAGLEGRLPDAQDFELGAVNAVGFHAGAHVVGRITQNLKTIYRDTGIPPKDAGTYSRTDPVLRGELIYTDVNGRAVTPKFNSMRPPSAEPFVKTDAPDPQEHAAEMFGILKDIGHETVSPGLARQNGYDPAMLLSDESNQTAATSILSSLSDRYNGDTETALIAFRDGTDVASKYIASGRDPETISPETQDFLKHTQDSYGITGTWNRVDWTKFPTANDTALRQFTDGTYKPTPEAIAGYLQDFGRRAGFRFVVGDKKQTMQGGTYSPQYVLRDMWKLKNGATISELGRRVFIPDTPEELNKRWYGMGRYEILYHEVGHALDHLVLNSGVGTTKTLSPELTEELVGVSKQFKPKLWQDQPNYNMRAEELMADGVATWISRPDLRASMPIFGKMHGEALKPYLDMAARALPARSEGGTGTWEPPPGPDGPEPHYGAAPPRGGPPGPPNKGGGVGPANEPSHDWDRTPLATLLSKFQNKVGVQPTPKKKMATGLEFELDAAKRLDQTQLRQGLLKPGQITTEDMFRNTYGSEGRWRSFLHHGPIDFFTRKPTGAPSVKEIADMIDKADSPDLEGWKDKRTAFNAYVLAERSISKAKQGIDIGLYDEGEAESVVRRLKPVFGEAKDKLQQWNNGVLQYAVDGGRISEAQRDAMIAADPSYMSIRRIMGDDASFAKGSGKGKFFRAANPYKKMEGSDRDITDPWFATMDNARLVIQETDRNAAKGHVVMSKDANVQWGLKRLESTGATIAEPGSDVYKPYRFAPAEEDAVSKAFGWRGGNDKQFAFYRNGKAELWEANDPDLARMIRGADSPGEINLIQKALGLPAAIERLGVTGDPGFALGILLKHQWTAWIAGEGHPPPYITAIRGMFHTLKMDDVYQHALANGALTHGNLTDIDNNLIKTDALSTLNETGVLKRTLNLALHPLQFSQMITESLTNYARVGNFAREVNKGADPFKAAMQSRTNYLDYAEQMTSQLAQNFAKMVPFFRAGLLGLRQSYEATTERPGETAFHLAAGVMLPVITMYALSRVQDQFLPDDQKSTAAPSYERRLYIRTPVIGPNGYRFKLALPFVAGPLVGAPLTSILDAIWDHDPHAFDGLLSEMAQDLTPSTFPALVKPIIEQVSNHNFFTGQPLVSDKLKGASSELQYTDATTEPAKKISAFLSTHNGFLSGQGLGINIPPIVIDNYAREWTGTVGMTVLKAMGSVQKPESPDDWVQTPFVKAFFITHPGMNSTDVDNFYKDSQEFEQAHQDKVLEVQRGLLSNARIDATKQRVVMLSRFKHTLNILREGMVRTNGNGTMTVDEKRQITDQLTNEAIAFARLGSQILKTNSYDPAVEQMLTQQINDTMSRVPQAQQ